MQTNFHLYYLTLHVTQMIIVKILGKHRVIIFMYIMEKIWNTLSVNLICITCNAKQLNEIFIVVHSHNVIVLNKQNFQTQCLVLHVMQNNNH